MVTKQIMFLPESEETVKGGIMVQDSSQCFIICGCCGGIFEPDEVEIYEEFEEWINISNKINGDYFKKVFDI